MVKQTMFGKSGKFPFLFDFIKYETLRVEVDDKTPASAIFVGDMGG